MPGYFDTTLVEAGWYLMKVLLYLSGIGIVAGVITLPLFYLVLGAVRAWFWGRDARDPAGPVGGLARRVLANVVSFAFPVLSFALTLIVLAYFGVFDLRADLKGNFLGMPAPRLFVPENPPVQLAVREPYDRVTRSMAESLAAAVPPKVNESDPRPAELQAEQQRADTTTFFLRGIRFVSLLPALLLGPFPTLVILLALSVGRNGITLVMRSLTRNLVRTSLTYLAVFILAFIVSLIWSALQFLAAFTQEKENNLKAIITERYQIPSMMRPTHVQTLKDLIAELPPEYRPKNGDDDIMTWAFVGGSTDPANRSFENILFLFCMQPRKILTMMDGLDELTGEQLDQLRRATEIMEANPKAVVIGKERLRLLKKRPGDRITLTSFNYPGLVFEFDIIGEFPEGRYDQSAIMNRVYLDRTIQAYEGTTGKPHPVADKALNLIWVRLPNKQAFETLAEKVNAPGKFSPAVKMETASSLIGSFLDPFKDVLFFMRVLLAPALLATMVLVISNAITITVRERRTEMAVLKVLGFRPWMVMALVLGESIFLGVLGGFMATASGYGIVNLLMGGAPLNVGFFPKFLLPADVLWWGPLVGGLAALLGSLLPALSARSVKVSEVFAKVA